MSNAAATYTATASNGMTLDLTEFDVWNNGGGAPARFVIVGQFRGGQAPKLAGQTGGYASSLEAEAERLVDHWGWRFAEVAEVVEG